MKYVCTICGYVYDEEAEGVPFADLPDSWTCPLCGAGKDSFEPQPAAKPDAEPAGEAAKPDNANAEDLAGDTAKSAAATAQDDAAFDDDMQRLSAGELAALCSNLARGCEKQYKAEEAALFAQLADYFAQHAPAVPDASVENLAALIQSDLSEGYPAVHGSAKAAQDRGTQRICVWGEKVTAILSTLIKRWEKEGDAFVDSTQVWVCSVCGFVYIGDEPPALCPVCKVPAWKFEKIEGRRAK